MVIWPALFLVSTLVQFPAVTAQRVFTTSENSGPACGKSTPATQCLTGVTCDEQLGECQCPGGFYGDGGFRCHPDARERTQVTGSDNTLITLANTSADLLWPCRTRFTEVKTVRSSDGNICHIQVFALNKLLGGRVAAAGVEVHFQLEAPDGSAGPNSGIGIRLEGIAYRKVFTYAEWGRDAFVKEEPVTEADPNYSPDAMDTDTDGSGSGDSPSSFALIDDGEDDSDDWGAPETLGLGQGKTVSTTTDADNFVVIKLPGCGADVRFRAPNEQASKQTQTPGIAVSVEKQKNPVFPDSETYLSESPTDNGLATAAFQNGQSLDLEVLHRSMMFAAKQLSTPAGEECEQTAFTYRSSCSSHSDRRQALTSCSFFLSRRPLAGCMDPETDGTGRRSLNAFKLCLLSICTQNAKYCLLLKNRVNDRGCMAHAPQEFQAMPCTA